MTITKTGRRVAFLGLLALVVAILPLTAASAQDEEAAAYIDFDINEEVEASDALQTSILASQQAFPDGTDTVLLTTSEDGADALVSGVLANDAALLYHNSDEGVVDAHVEEITRLGATEVIIIGGEERIDADVETALTDMGLNVTRLAGDERISTANEVLAYAEDNRDDFNETASHLSRAFGTDDNSQTAFADAVGLGAWDAQGGAGTVLAPSDADVLSEDYPTTQYFTDVNPENETIVPIGGEAAVPAGVVDYLTGEPAEQTAGDRVENEDANNRAGTAVAINEARGLDAGDLAGVVVVDAFADNFFIDAYATSALAGNNDYAVVVSNGDSLSPETAEWLGSPAFAQNDGTTDVICMPKTSGEACAEAVTATGGDPEDIETVSLDGEPETPPMNTGLVTSTNNIDTYTFVAEGAEAATTVGPLTADELTDGEFTVDGAPASSGIFFSEIGTCDTVTYTEMGAEDGENDLHELVNGDCADITEGVVGNVDLGVPSFWIIEPLTGTPLNGPFDYSMSAVHFIDGTPSSIGAFGDDINEGDDIAVLDDDPTPGTTTFQLTNNVVSGLVADLDTTVAGVTEFKIGGLGDDLFGGVDLFVANDPEFPGTEVYLVDGEEVDFADFTAAISDGDEATYQRVGDEETFSIGNLAPATVEGVVTPPAPPVALGDGGTITYIPTGADMGGATFTYTPAASFIVDGLLVAEDVFEADVTSGDAITYRPADAGTSTTERVMLTNQNLAGALEDGIVGAGYALDVYDANGVYIDTYADGGSDRYFLDGVEVTQPDFETEIDDVELEDGYTIEIVEGIVGNEVRVTTPEA